jgi:hypothetical protein
LKEAVSSPNTLMVNDKSYATLVLGFPELEFSPNEVPTAEPIKLFFCGTDVGA